MNWFCTLIIPFKIAVIFSSFACFNCRTRWLSVDSKTKLLFDWYDINKTEAIVSDTTISDRANYPFQKKILGPSASYQEDGSIYFNNMDYLQVQSSNELEPHDDFTVEIVVQYDFQGIPSNQPCWCFHKGDSLGVKLTKLGNGEFFVNRFASDYYCEIIKVDKHVLSCRTCDTGYELSVNQSKCLKCPDNCFNCREKTVWNTEYEATECLDCKPGHFLDKNICNSCPSGCLNCTNTPACLECNTAYTLRKDTQDCLPCPLNCNFCEWNSFTKRTECKECKDAYAINNDGGCTSCGKYCISCIHSKYTGISCSACSSLAFKSEDNGRVVCQLCSQFLLGCKHCLNKDRCSVCESSAYSLSNTGRCLLCSQAVHFACIECDITSGHGTCKKCQTEFYVKEDICAPCPPNCDLCDEINGRVECVKCKANYGSSNTKICDHCPNNCLKCAVSEHKLKCLEGQCIEGYTLNEAKQCSKCPDNCKQCTYNNVRGKTECLGTNSNHFCLENANGKSWTKRVDGECIPCPQNCDKCYFPTANSDFPVCYPSKCQRTFGFDDLTGFCFPCQSGCDLCKKTGVSSTCLKCSKGYAPEYKSGTSDITLCRSCSSISNCDYCEVILGEVKCLRSPCSVKENSLNKKFSFTTQACSLSCPSDSSCNSKSIVDEGGICYCRSCPKGSQVILDGPNSGVCKSCGSDCIECVLNSERTDVECVTCSTAKQWLTVNIAGVEVKGCYDCSDARPSCAILEYDGTSCKCKLGGCIGDESTNYRTVFQNSLGNRNCKTCQTLDPNALWCTGTYESFSIAGCKGGYDLLTTKCLRISPGCSRWDPNHSGIDKNYMKCLRCINGYYLYNEKCFKCSDTVPHCLSCIYHNTYKVICTKCSIGKGYNCGHSTCTSSNCAEPWVLHSNPDLCGCLSCLTNTYDGTNFANFYYSCAAVSYSLPDCSATIYISPTPSTLCRDCSPSYILSDSRSTCVSSVGWNCEQEYLYGNPLQCQVPAINHFKVSDSTTPLPVQTIINGCVYYKYLQTDSPSQPSNGRCAQCEDNKIIEFTSSLYYTCQTCSLQSSMTNCLLAISLNSKCLCSTCQTNIPGSNYLMKPDMSGCLKCFISFCAKYSLQLVSGQYYCRCTLCLDEAVLNDDGTKCVDCSSTTCVGGSKYVSDDMCKCRCKSDEILSKDEITCISCSEMSISQCKVDKLYLDNNICKCSECLEGYTLSFDSKQCLSCTTSPGAGTSHCRKCRHDKNLLTHTSFCVECNDNYGLYHGIQSTGTCIQCGVGCKACEVHLGSTNKQCKECLAGYALNSEKICVQCPQTPMACSDCYFDSSDETKILCKQFSCIGNSALRDKDFKCEICPISNCLLCTKDISSKFVCLKCSKSYFIDSSGQCESCASDCDFCTEKDKCLPDGCKDGFIRKRLVGTCVKCTGEGVLRCSYESTLSDNLIPQLCESSYYLNNEVTPNACEKCASHCKLCNKNGAGKCDIDKCEDGYFYSSFDKKCYERNGNCLGYQRLFDMTICSSCNYTTHVLVSGVCRICPVGCNGCSFTHKYSCSSCVFGYYLNEVKSCSPCPGGCKECVLEEERVRCTSCLSRYGLKNGLCESCGVRECQSCQEIETGAELECTSCASNHFLSTNICSKCPENCEICILVNKNLVCSKCYKNFARDTDGTCVPCSTNCNFCTVLTDKTTRCQSCISNKYSLQSNGRCKLCSDVTFENCETCSDADQDDKTKCRSCRRGYTLKNDGSSCIYCSIDKCTDCIHGKLCEKCEDNTFKANYGTRCAKKCYSCVGNRDTCGGELSKHFNFTASIKVVNCTFGDCWVIRRERENEITYIRKCGSERCSTDYSNENCRTVDGQKECSKCCSTSNCNNWFLDGTAGKSRDLPMITLITFSIILHYTCVIVIIVN
ncbi:DgyrCDS3250 [Dimorphilus gyrociliatus]|uniref:DgyrCDS3250 n=1 Tax=Dimorphilus gyrociliatus TaxID=2664684 RepID=A0A7I8VD30_9ANNE|nr:DgyrCDS3250 [Dimorphilus gyrociliatus]